MAVEYECGLIRGIEVSKQDIPSPVDEDHGWINLQGEGLFHEFTDPYGNTRYFFGWVEHACHDVRDPIDGIKKIDPETMDEEYHELEWSSVLENMGPDDMSTDLWDWARSYGPDRKAWGWFMYVNVH